MNQKQSSFFSLERIYKAFFYSLNGLKVCFQNEAAFRQEVFLCLILTPVPFILDLNGLQEALMLFCLYQILLMELINSAIEAVVDRISTDFHDLSKIAKDIGSSLVLIAFLICTLVWALILKDLLV